MEKLGKLRTKLLQKFETRERGALFMKLMAAFLVLALAATATFSYAFKTAMGSIATALGYLGAKESRSRSVSKAIDPYMLSISPGGNLLIGGEPITQEKKQTSYVYFEDSPDNVRLNGKTNKNSAADKASKEKSAPMAAKTEVKQPEKKASNQTAKASSSTVKEVKTEKRTSVQKQANKPLEDRANGYSFKELGLKQISDIDVPDSIRFSKDGIPLNYKRALRGNATAYYCGTTTATGTSVHPGVVAVDPGIIPYGSKMFVIGDNGTVYGYASAEDTGGFIYWSNGPLLDLFFWSYDDCVQWGKRGVTAYIF